MKRVQWILVLLIVVATVAGAAFLLLKPQAPEYSPSNSPVAAVQNFCQALFFNDKPGLIAASASTSDVDFLLEHRTQAFCRRVDSIGDAQYRQLKPGDGFTIEGRPQVVPDQYSGESTALVLVDFGLNQDPLPFRVLLVDGKWRVDQGLLARAARVAVAASGAGE